MKQNNFIFLSEILGLSCFDASTGKKIGVLSDLSAHFREAYPRVTGIVIRTGFGKHHVIRWDTIKSFDFGRRKITIETRDSTYISPDSISDDEVLIKDIFLDKQIISVSGSKVVRVNDLHFLSDSSKMWIVHFDVGFKGLLRRLGCEKAVSVMADFLFSYTLKDTFIRWKDSQLAMEANAYGEYELRIPVNKLSEMHPADLADILAELGLEDRMMIFGSLNPSAAAVTLQEVSKNLRVQIAENLEPDKFAFIVEAMQKDEAADLLEHVHRDTKVELFRHLSPETVVELMELMNYSVRSAGSIMNTEFASVRDGCTVAEALDIVRGDACRIESLHYVYSVNIDNELTGVASLKDLICAEGSASVSYVMKKNVVKTQVDSPIDEVAHIFFKYNFFVIPVVDDANKLEGVITIKDALEAAYPQIHKEIEG